jgi:hypothetical protein
MPTTTQNLDQVLIFEHVVEESYDLLAKAREEWNCGFHSSADRIQSEVAQNVTILRKIATDCGSDWRDVRDVDLVADALARLIEYRLHFRSPCGKVN